MAVYVPIRNTTEHDTVQIPGRVADLGWRLGAGDQMVVFPRDTLRRELQGRLGADCFQPNGQPEACVIATKHKLRPEMLHTPASVRKNCR